MSELRVSQAQKAKSRQKILTLAAIQIKERVLASIAIAELMKRAGLTQGALYGHFASRAELLLEATKEAKKIPEQLLRDIAARKKKLALSDVIDVYLNDVHINNPGYGCVVCALVSEGRSAPKAIRTELSENYRNQIKFVKRALTGKSSETRAIGILSALMGAVSLARTLNDPELVRGILKETKRLILDSQKNNE